MRCGDLLSVRACCEQELGADTLSALVAAAALGHEHIVRYICELPMCYSYKQCARGDHFLALRQAAENGHVAIVRRLCQWHTETWGTTRYRIRSTLVSAAVEGQHLPMVQFVCEAPGANALSVLETAASRGYEHVVRYICSLPATDEAYKRLASAVFTRLFPLPAGYNADPPKPQFDALTQAAQFGHTSTAQYLVQWHVDKRGELWPDVLDPLVRAAVWAQHLPMVRWACELSAVHGFKLRVRIGPLGPLSPTPAHMVTRFHDASVLRFLCQLPEDHGIALDIDTNAMLTTASRRGRLDVVRVLCELPRRFHLDPSTNDNDPICTAATRGHWQVVKYLCELPRERGVNPCARQFHVFCEATYQANVNVVRWLFDLPLVNRPACLATLLVAAVDKVCDRHQLRPWGRDQRSVEDWNMLRARMLRFLVMECPGGVDAWLQYETCAAQAFIGFKEAVLGCSQTQLQQANCKWVLVRQLANLTSRSRVWRRRRSLLMLRRLREMGRAHVCAL